MNSEHDGVSMGVLRDCGREPDMRWMVRYQSCSLDIVSDNTKVVTCSIVNHNHYSNREEFLSPST